jgi:hypothetical protein
LQYRRLVQLTVRASLAALAALALGCTQSHGRAGPSEGLEERFVSAPALEDRGSACADVGERRVCWQGEAVLPVPRPVPERSARRGWRCHGMGEHRTCEDRRHGADAFECRETLCSQRHPRMPDDGEWECADLDGIVVCHRLADAAGVEPGARDPAWICGDRRGPKAERVCVDPSPDRPDGGPFDCKFQWEPDVPARVCARGGSLFDRTCDGGCPLGSRCADGRCWPLEPVADCWLDADCGPKAKCAYGSCRRTGP